MIGDIKYIKGYIHLDIMTGMWTASVLCGDKLMTAYSEEPKGALDSVAVFLEEVVLEKVSAEI